MAGAMLVAVRARAEVSRVLLKVDVDAANMI